MFVRSNGRFMVEEMKIWDTWWFVILMGIMFLSGVVWREIFRWLL